jgi:hypothetical protein
MAALVNDMNSRALDGHFLQRLSHLIGQRVKSGISKGALPSLPQRPADETMLCSTRRSPAATG